MNIDLQFPRQIAVTLLCAVALGGYPLLRYAPPDVVTAVALGAALGTLNVLAGFAAIEHAFNKSYTVFLRWVLGGMGLRLLVLLGLLAALILVFHVNATALVVSVLGFYAVYLVLEILFIQRKVLTKTQP